MRDALINRWFAQFRKRGDPKALAKVFDATAPELLRVAAHLVRDEVEAEDVLQSTFLAAIEGADSWDANRRVMPWLVGILANQAGLARRRRARRIDPASVARPAPADPAAIAAEREVSEALRRTIADLPETYRSVLHPHLLEGASGLVIAKELGIAPGTVRVRIHRGLEMLRKALPPALATSALLGIAVPRGLAAVRGEVLRTAGAAIPTTAAVATGLVASTLISGAVMGKKIGILAVALLVCAGTWSLSIDPEQPTPPSRAVEHAELGNPFAPDAAPPAKKTEETSTTLIEPTDTGIAGKVVGPDHTAPVAGARVLLVGPGRPRQETTSAEDGTFRFPGPARHGMRLIASADGHAPTNRPLPMEGEIVLGLIRGMTVSGEVKTQDGAPVPGAVVEFLDDCRLYLGSRKVVADARGRYWIDGIFPYRVMFRARSPDGRLRMARRFHIPKRSTVVKRNITLYPANSITVLITEGRSGPPIGGADVLLVTDAERRIRCDRRVPLELMVYAAAGTTGVDGRVRFDAVPGGEFYLVAGASGFALDGLHRVTSGKGESQIELFLSRGATLEGRVVEADGRPAAGAQVSLITRSPPWARNLFRRLPELHLELPDSLKLRKTADENGGFRFANLPGSAWTGYGPVTLRASLSGAGKVSRGPIELKAGEVTQGMDLVLTGKAPVEVTVRDIAGQVPPGAKVRGQPVDERGIAIVEFDIAGPAWLEVSAPGHASVSMTLATPLKGPQSLSAILPKAVTFTGRVVGEGGEVPEEVTVYAQVRERQKGWNVNGASPRVDKDGRFTSLTLPGTPLIVTVIAQGYVRKMFEIEDPGSGELTLVVQKSR